MRPRRNLKELYMRMGFTDEQIANHYAYKRRKSAEARERQKVTNNHNRIIIDKMKSELLGKNHLGYLKVLYVRPTTDGEGVWIKYRKTFTDNSSGEFRIFYGFNEYKLENVIEDMKL